VREVFISLLDPIEFTHGPNAIDSLFQKGTDAV